MFTEIQTPSGERVHLRPERPEDEKCLQQLFVGSRSPEFTPLGLSDEMRASLLQMQFKAQRAGYRHAYPAASYWLLWDAQSCCGRIVLNRSDGEIRVVDIIIAENARGRGLGTTLLQAVCAEANRDRQPVRLRVLEGHRAARWYERLGFRTVAREGVHLEMEWRPDLNA